MVELSATLRPAREPRPQPTPAQRRAADPRTSVWVTASAGTGKTRVLADRVLRLLLAGIDPRRILCLTFTKAAAAEMTTRIQDDLGRFATWPEADLAIELQRLLGRAPTDPERSGARALLPRVLDLPGGLPIMTIHGFCQSLLRRFSLEADVPPHFEVIEPRDANDLLRQAQNDVLAGATGLVQSALARLAVILGESSLREGLGALREDRLKLSELLHRCGGDIETMIEQVAAVLGVDVGMTLERLQERICCDPLIDWPALRAACRALERGKDSDQTRALIIARWLEAGLEERIAGIDDYLRAFCTKERSPLARLITKDAASAGPAAEDALRREQNRLIAVLDQQKRLLVLERTAALLRVGAAVMERYDDRKDRLAGLDYDDLIACARRLLERPGMSSWVNYKLDQQVDHLLVDEGQDTSPEQWAIIEALCSEFFAGEGAHEGRRTLFVVGDQKQSIFSFQGADLATFNGLRLKLRDRARAARLAWREEPLNLSFRSARPVLDVVDAVFARADARDGVVAGMEPLRHETTRPDAPGSVEVWPLVEVEDGPKPEAWELPDRREAAGRAERHVAEAIAKRILDWRRDEAQLASKRRPIRPGDIMVLLPRRGTLQDLLVRELKRLKIPVAGADRLALVDEIAVMDLVALGHALLLPEDDLTLAAVLRSPLFGLSEDDLFELAHARGEASLYQRLREHRDARPVLAEAFERFTGLLGQVDFLPPFEFYTRLLGEGGGRRRFLARLGGAAIEPIEAFLAQALAYEQAHPPSLQGFLHWLGADTTDLIRDPDRPRDEVRVLTIHGAKGLEAPIVFLADVTFVPDMKDRLLWLEPEGLPLWRVSRSLQDPVSERAQQQARQRELQEQRRLLYVAMTRAQDHLVVTGWKRNGGRSETAWYDMIDAIKDELQGVEPLQVPRLDGTGWRYANHRPSERAQRMFDLGGRAPGGVPPSWLDQPAPEEPTIGPALSPSRLFEEDDVPVRSPLGQLEAARFLRGRLIHRLLQSLPERAENDRQAAMARYLAQSAFGLTQGEQAEIARSVGAILALPELSPLFGQDSRAEVPLVGVVGGQAIAGQVDRLVVTEEEVILIDYKTNREPPADASEIPAIYWRQMAAYAALLQEIHPGRPVRCALLWTEGPRLMWLDEAALAHHSPARMTA